MRALILSHSGKPFFPRSGNENFGLDTGFSGLDESWVYCLIDPRAVYVGITTGSTRFRDYIYPSGTFRRNYVSSFGTDVDPSWVCGIVVSFSKYFDELDLGIEDRKRALRWVETRLHNGVCPHSIVFHPLNVGRTVISDVSRSHYTGAVLCDRYEMLASDYDVFTKEIERANVDLRPMVI